MNFNMHQSVDKTEHFLDFLITFKSLKIRQAVQIQFIESVAN